MPQTLGAGFAFLLATPRPVHHYDLYRLSGPDDMRNLELPDSFTRGTQSTPLAESVSLCF
jgi:tRNA A37 threonylcarbamoyladenosine biosynthesis protein TsaE